MRGFFAAFLLTISVTSFGENRWESHGHNYSYTPAGFSGESRVIFPIVWDVRSANDLILAWQSIYEPIQPNPVIPILQEALECGFNTALVRSELENTWFPEQPGDDGDKFFPLAGSIRDLGMNVIAGGIKTELGQDIHNQAVIDYLSLYITQTAGHYAGDVIGSFAFDEPDVKYLQEPEHSAEWIEFISYWNEQYRSELGLPALCYFAKFADSTPEGQMDYYTDTTSVLNRMARHTDMIGMDMYPVMNNFRRTDLLHSSTEAPVFIGATDLVQDDPLQSGAMNSKDELIRVFESGDSATVSVDNIYWNGEDLSIQACWSSPLPFLPDGIAASDFRAGYAIQEGEGYVNSGVILWQTSLSVDSSVLIVSHEGMPFFCQLPQFPGSEQMKPFFFTPGQTDYWADSAQREGIIGHGRLALLAGLIGPDGEKYLMLYAASAGGSPVMETVFDEPVKLAFPAEGAVWGTFWGTWYESGTAQAVAANGFTVFDENGDYVVLNQLDRNNWQVYPAGGTVQFVSLFGSSEMPDIMRVCRIDGDYPSFFAGRDLLVGWFKDRNLIVSAYAPSAGESLGEIDSISITGLPGQVTGFDLMRNDYRYSDRPIFTVDGGGVYIGIGSMDTGISSGTIEVKLENYCTGDSVITGIRAMHTRDAIRSALLPSDEGFYIPQCEIYEDKVDNWRFQWFPEAQQVGMSLGVQQTARINTLFSVIQSYGRHSFALPSYCASPDTMLYLVTAPLVAGARGLIFYALDLAMMSGNGGDDGYSRAPFILQNWGPSRDTENVDMIGVIHGAVASLTGNVSGGMDYIGSLVDTSWTVLDGNEVFNRQEADTLLNFIALANSSNDSILVIAVNEATSTSPFDPGIVFADLPPGFRIASSEGFLPCLVDKASAPGSRTLNELDYTGMPPLSASLITMTVTETGQCTGWYLNTATSSAGITSVSFSLCSQEAGELAIYDLAGRKINRIWEGFGYSTPISMDVIRGGFPAGLYFVILSGEHGILAGKCILW